MAVDEEGAIIIFADAYCVSGGPDLCKILDFCTILGWERGNGDQMGCGWTEADVSR